MIQQYLLMMPSDTPIPLSSMHCMAEPEVSMYCWPTTIMQATHRIRKVNW